jgi:NAD(P) transhydrogenase subunit alpha
MKIAVVKETFRDERRVALVPATIGPLRKAGLEVIIQAGAGSDAGFPDDEYRAKGAEVVPTRQEAFAADAILVVRCRGANPESGLADLAAMRPSQLVIGICDPWSAPAAVREAAEAGVTLFALELIPRITRAQSMDVLSSMATISGYRAVLLAATHLPKMFPLMMTAAGTVSPARVLVIGVGVAGLQAIATARRLGAVVQAYDVRPAAREQVESLGAKFVQLPLEVADAEDQGGYAKAQGEEFYRKQRELMAQVVAENDVVITTAAIPGKTSPLLVTKEAVERMQAGSVIVDLAAERGGNCQLTKPDQKVIHHGVTILGPTNLPSDVPYHASQMYARNISAFLLNMICNGQLQLNLDDEIVRETLLTRDGQVVQPALRQTLGMPSAPQGNVTAKQAPSDGNPTRTSASKSPTGAS